MQFNYNGNEFKSGIYKIINKTTNRFYIGSAKKFKTRWQTHSRQLRSGNHPNKYLQHDFSKYGETQLEFHILELTNNTKEERLLREQFYLDQFFDNMKNCYNFRKYARAPDGEKHKRSMKEIWQRPEYRENQSKIQSQRTKELWKDSKYRENHVQAIQKFTETKEFREKLRVATQERWNDEEYKNRVKKVFQSEEFKQKIGQKTKEFWQRPEYRKKVKESIKKCWENNPQKKAEIAEFIRKIKAKTYILKSPEGEIIKITNMEEFCRMKGNLHSSGMCKVANGKWASYKKWTKPSEIELVSLSKTNIS